MEIRRERFDSETAMALADALEAELLATYDGDPGSGGLPAASVSSRPTAGRSSSAGSTAKRSPTAASPATTA